LERFQRLMPDLPVDLLIPLSEPWMKADVLAYTALQRGKLAGARALHLHASQLTAGTVDFIRQGGCEVHAWGINDRQALKTASELQITRICTDNLELALQFRSEQSIYERMDQSTI
jgi:glycerophosphoryl diester phosphodiesterase